MWVKGGDFISDFAKNIKRRRPELGLSQEQLAEKLAVTRQTVSNWERSVSFPDLPTLERIAESLDTDPAELIYPDGRAQGRPGAGRSMCSRPYCCTSCCFLWAGECF